MFFPGIFGQNEPNHAWLTSKEENERFTEQILSMVETDLRMSKSEISKTFVTKQCFL